MVTHQYGKCNVLFRFCQRVILCPSTYLIVTADKCGCLVRWLAWRLNSQCSIFYSSHWWCRLTGLRCLVPQPCNLVKWSENITHQVPRWCHVFCLLIALSDTPSGFQTSSSPPPPLYIQNKNLGGFTDVICVTVSLQCLFPFKVFLN